MRFLSQLILSGSFLISSITLGKTISNPHFYSILTPNNKESFILGTIHGGVDISELPNQVIQKFNESTLFINEWTFSDDEVTAIINGHLVDEQLKKFHHKGDALSSEVKQQLINNWGIDSRLANVIKSNDCEILSFAGPISSGYMDIHFIEMARKQNKKILSLDTQEELDKLNEQHPTEPCDVKNILNQVTPSQFKSYQLNMISEYRSGIIPIHDVSPITRGRNQFWIPKISTNLKEGNVFIAVGMNHLYGPEGLLHLLEQLGYQVSRLFY